MIVCLEDIDFRFIYWNHFAFNDELPTPQYGILHSFRTCGYFQCNCIDSWFRRNLYNFSISITDYYDFTMEQFDDILVHEMIHYYLAYTGLDKRIRHGKEFKKMARKLNLNHGLNITSTVDLSIYKRREGTSKFQYWLATFF